MMERRRTVLKRFQSQVSRLGERVSHISVRTVADEAEDTSERALWWRGQVRFLHNNRRQIFWATLYTGMLLAIFAERFYYFSFEREHAGLRRLAGYGVSVTRGAASAMMLTYSSLLVTMARNTLTRLRETALHRFVPFDSFHAFHKYIAFWALLFTVMHIIGHGFNFYHIATQASADLNCYFREYFRATHVLASFHYWAWTTITGVTGILLTLVVVVMYVFAQPYSRRHVFNAFWRTHNLYIPFYILLILHGSGRLVAEPLTGYFLLGPLVLFVLDKLTSLSRHKLQIPVLSASLLPSGVTRLVIKKPAGLEYKSGQWVRVACLKLSPSEFHPFTLTSAPHEEHLSLHIRAVGPWTSNLRRVYDQGIYAKMPLPMVSLDGPYGEGHQDWYRFPVSVLVGGGIGVTPFASILKDIAFKAKIGAKFPCKKVYFLWVTRTQQSFEWMTDIIREVEAADDSRLVEVHIFITQLKQKFDLRTAMLYICERHFQRIEGLSLFTGLRAITHFGRPHFHDLLDSIATIYPEAGRIGVFSCGPPQMTSSVDNACNALNVYDKMSFHHHFENF